MVSISDILQKIEKFTSDELQAFSEFKTGGGKVAALFNRNFPASLLWGFGLWPVRILTGATGDAEDVSERLVRPDVCPFCKCLLGNFLEKRSPHSQCDFAVGAITCDMMRRLLERLSTDIGLPVFPVQVPSTTTDDSLNYYTLGVQNVIDNLSSFLDKEIDYDIVRKREQERFTAAAILSELLWKGKTSPLINHRLCQLFSWVGPESFLRFIQQLIPDLPQFNPEFTILLTGSVLLYEDDTLIRIITEQNVGVVPLNSSGLNMVEGLEDVSGISDDKIIPELSRICFRVPGNIRTRPNNHVYDWINEAIIKTNARGVVVKSLSFCDLWYTEKVRLKQMIPVAVLVLDTGYGKGTEGQVATRIETFLETLS